MQQGEAWAKDAGARPAGEARAARPADPSPGPPSCNTGGKLTWDSREISIDWYRVSHQAGTGGLARVVARLTREFGAPEETHGMHGFRRGLAFPSGALVWYVSQKDEFDDPDPACCVDVQGQALGASRDRVRLCRDLAMGGSTRRLDVAVDLRHEDRVGLLDSALASCLAGEMCSFRTFEPVSRWSNVPGGVELSGRSLYLGSMKSDRHVCIYDKGLETGESEEGRWERVEMRWRGDQAVVAGQRLLGFGGDQFAQTAFDMVIGGMDFRLNTGAEHLDRREVCSWWVEFCEGGLPVSCIPPREKTRLASFAKWVAECVVPTLKGLGSLRLDAKGRTVERPPHEQRSFLEVLDYLVGSGPPSKRRGVAVLLADLESSVEARPFATAF